MRRHRLRARGSERHIDLPRIHQADNLLQVLRDIGVREIRRRARILPRKLRLPESFDFGVLGKTNKVLVRVDDHV